MLNWYAKTFQISEENLTKAGLRRTKIFAGLMLLIVPFEVINDDWFDNFDSVIFAGIGALLIVACLIGFIALLLSPMVHRFWARDKYLDEWEIEIKRKGMSAGYKVLFGALVIGLVASSFLTDFSEQKSADISFMDLDGIAFALLILAFGVQTLTQLSLIRPIDDDEVEIEANKDQSAWMQAVEAKKGRSTWSRVAVGLAIVLLFFGPPFVQGFVDGVTEGLTDGIHDAGPVENGQLDAEGNGAKK